VIHEELLAALDRADVDSVRDLLADSASLLVLDQRSQPTTLSGSSLTRQQCAAMLVALWSSEVEHPRPAKVLSGSVVAEGAGTATIVFQFERPELDAAKFRATLVLVREEDPESSELEMKIRHLHISTADRKDF
jgi:hypothetical protein